MTKPNELPVVLPQTARRQVLCLAFESEAQHAQLGAAPKLYRAWLDEQFAQHPELFPAAFAGGYAWHSRYQQKKQKLTLRRVRLKMTRAVFTLAPSFLLPYAVGRTDAVEKALALAQCGVPAEALAFVFGRDASFDERWLRSLGRFHLGGTTIKAAATLPPPLVADEKITWEAGDPERLSPFADLNGFQYHENWRHNLLIAASLGGQPT